jgi:hypothetical protein
MDSYASTVVALVVSLAILASLVVQFGRARLPVARVLLFLLGCILVRALITLIAYRQRGTAFARNMGALALLPALGFFYLYATKQRAIGPETFGERIWWTELRPVHGALWLAFAASALVRSEFAWVFLSADLALGLGAWLARSF